MISSSVEQLLNNHPHWIDIVIGASGALVAAVIFGLSTWILAAIRRSASIRVGANWTLDGLGSQPGFIRMHPNLNVISRRNSPKLIVHSIWVRESKSNRKPGNIYGKIDLTSSTAASHRTTGGDPLNLTGPIIICPNEQSNFEKALKYPVWIQTTDNQWFKAQSAGNPPALAERIRSKLGW